MDKGDLEYDHEIRIHSEGQNLVRICVEESLGHTTIIFEQRGIGMLDGQDCLELMESVKSSNVKDVLGGQYGIGFKQFLAVMAHLSNASWKFDMFGTIIDESSEGQGWSRMWSTEATSTLIVNGVVCQRCINDEVRNLLNNLLLYDYSYFILVSIILINSDIVNKLLCSFNCCTRTCRSRKSLSKT